MYLTINGLLDLLKCNILTGHLHPCSFDQQYPAREVWYLADVSLMLAPAYGHTLPCSSVVNWWQNLPLVALSLHCGCLSQWIWGTDPTSSTHIYLPLYLSGIQLFLGNVLFRPKVSSGRRVSVRSPASDQTFHSLSCLEQISKPRSV